MENQASLPHSPHYEHIRGVFKIHLALMLALWWEPAQADRLAPFGLPDGFGPAV
jgi:hypothetical protein